MLKDCSNELSGSLCYLINLTMINGTIPNEWKLAKAIPFFKYGDRTDSNNYRPISILPILSKILERVVHSQLLDHVEKYHLLTNCQYGYRKNRSKRNTELTWFTDCLFSKKQLVNFDKCSSKESVLCGVPQGSILGPSLFMICFNDSHTCLRYAKTIKFADDTYISAT